MTGDIATMEQEPKTVEETKPKPERRRCKVCGQLRPTKWGKCERCRKADDYDEVEHARDHFRDMTLELRAEVHALKVEAAAKPTPDNPNWLHIKPTRWSTDAATLQKVLQHIAPVSGVVAMEWDHYPTSPGNRPRHAVWFEFKKEDWQVSDALLRKVLAAVEPIAEYLTVDYGRR